MSFHLISNIRFKMKYINSKPLVYFSLIQGREISLAESASFSAVLTYMNTSLKYTKLKILHSSCELLIRPTKRRIGSGGDLWLLVLFTARIIIDPYWSHVRLLTQHCFSLYQFQCRAHTDTLFYSVVCSFSLNSYYPVADFELLTFWRRTFFFKF